MSLKEQNEIIANEIATFNARKSLTVAAIIIIAAFIVNFFLPKDPADFGVLCTIPALLMIVYIFVTKRIIEALTIGAVVGFIMCSEPGTNVMWDFSESLLNTMMSEDIAWLIIVCGLMGGIISLIERSGGAYAFGQWASARAKSEKAALIWTWILGCIIFIDDYLNSMTVGSCMAPLTDKHKTPREMLAYVCDSTAAPLCVLIPITTWAVFCGRILTANGWQEDGASEIGMFIKTIPFNLYAWIAALIVPLVILGVIPKIGPMKKAYQRVAEGGPLAPPGSEKITILESDKEDGEMNIPENPHMFNFFVPIIVLVVATIVFDTDMEMGVLATLLVMFVMYMAQNIMSASEFWDIIIKGIQNMILPLMLMVMAFVFADMNETIGFTAWCIESATKVMTPATAPMIIFLVLACTEFITGTNWGMYVIALPIIIPLAMSIGVSMPLVVGACISAGVFGSHICFYSDATVLTSAACGCDNFRHAFTQMPFGIMAAILSFIGYAIMGFVMA
ncbi:MAG: sodium:proton antiporter [Firmicutes bacterium]|nr:sodium:proton antiporter [Bacillota bacterium]